MATPRIELSSSLGTQALQLQGDLRAAALSTAPVLITGPRSVSGLVARAIHDQAPRRSDTPFIAIPSHELYDALAPIEMDGLGLNATRLTERCTLFVDAVDELCSAAQERLRTFLDTVYAGGASAGTPPLDIRLMSATSEDLSERMATGRFRADLFYRLNVVHLALPTTWGITPDSPVHALLSTLHD